MNVLPLSRRVLETRLAEIKKDVTKLEAFRSYSPDEFMAGESFAIAEHYLRRALEAVFEIGNHVLSRLPFAASERPLTYKAIAQKLGACGMMDKEFADGPLVRMAGYRHRFVHFYDEVSQVELYEIIRNNLGDFDTFARRMVEILENPSAFGVTVV